MFKFYIISYSLFLSLFFFSQNEKFYSTIQNNDKIILEKGLYEINTYKNSITLQVYKGALIAKLAQFEKKPQQKIEQFKKGVELIENGIKSEPNNVEFRFIRFIIQEKSPKILRYQSNINEDKKFIEENYITCNQIIKKQIINYSKLNNSLNIK